MSNIVFPCPACGTKYSVPPQHAGKTTTCKKCGAQVAVPVPASDGPTLAGSTRTIRRSDIEEAAGGARRQTHQIIKKDPTVEVQAAGPKRRTVQVDMAGGESVMRKEVSPPPLAAAPAGRFAAPRRAGASVAPPPPVMQAPPLRGMTPGRPAPGRSMPPGMPMGAKPKKKSNTPMIVGAIGAGVLVIAIIAVVVVTSSGGNKAPDGGNTNIVADGGGTKLDPEKAVLSRLDREFNDKRSLSAAQVRTNYGECRKRKENPDFKSRISGWGEELRKRTLKEMSPEETYEIAINELEPEGINVLELMERVFKEISPGTYKTVTDNQGNQKRVFNEDYRLKDAAKRLGYEKYAVPDIFERNYSQWGFAEYREYETELEKVRLAAKGDYITTEQRKGLIELEGKVAKLGQELQKQHDKDGFAINARLAYLRFCFQNKGGAAKQRAFEPKALNREGETVEECWTYTYWKPFIVFIEKTPLMNEDEIKKNQETKANLLRQLVVWFDNNIKKPFNLQRVKPMGNGERAEQEGWPMEIVVLKDEETFLGYMDNEIEGGRIPGARAMYRIADHKDRAIEKVISWDDAEGDRDLRKRWFNESVIIHETFHMLSDYYATGPLAPGDLGKRPRYTSILIQEGLTDYVAGFNRQGEDSDAQFAFAKQNHLRLRSFQRNYNELLNKRLIYRLQDMLRCTHYGKCRSVARERAIELGMPARLYNVLAAMDAFVGMFYETSCLAIQFLNDFKDANGKHPYRDGIWKFIEKDYTGQLHLPSYDDPAPAVNEFKALMGIKTDADWERINKEFLDFVLALKPADVGVSGGGEIDPDKVDDGDENDGNGFRLPPRWGVLPPSWPRRPEPSRN